jgi:hypothetical protein
MIGVDVELRGGRAATEAVIGRVAVGRTAKNDNNEHEIWNMEEYRLEIGIFRRGDNTAYIECTGVVLSPSSRTTISGQPSILPDNYFRTA